MVNKERKQSIDFALGMLIVGGSLSFKLVESEVFRQFVSCLDPTYNIPSRQTLSTTIVEKVKAKVVEAIKPYHKGIKGTLMIDGWKNSSNNTKSVAAMVKPEGGEGFFLKSYDFSIKSEDHFNLGLVVEDAKCVSSSTYGINITSYVSDNAANMLKTGKESKLIAYGCKAHVGNLYVNDVFDRTVYDEVHEVLIQFRQTNLQNMIKEKDGKSIYLANNTRWKVFELKIFHENIGTIVTKKFELTYIDCF